MRALLERDVRQVWLAASQAPLKRTRGRHPFTTTRLGHRVASRPASRPASLSRPCSKSSLGPFLHQKRHESSITSQDHDARTLHDIEVPKPPMAIVFTDIVKSTALWEKSSSIMTRAMEIHDDLIRRLCANHSGYEVKQNGDGFMIAFQSTADTLNFCLDVQTELQEQDWPAPLLDMGPSQPIVDGESERETDGGQGEEKVLWKGLRLRMSAHFGEPVCKWNDVIGRMDYLGPVVNRAARFVGVCEGGQIVVSEEFLAELRKSQKRSGSGSACTREYEVQLLGERHLAGVTEEQKLYFIVPQSLIGRLDYFPKKRYVQASKGNLLENG